MRVVGLLILVLVMALVACQDPTPTPTSAPTASPIAMPTAIPTASPSPSPTVTPTPSPTPVPTPPPTPRPTPSPTPSPLYLDGWRNVPGTSSLERAKPDLALKIISLPWVSDGIGSAERESVQQVVSAAMLDEPVFLAVVDRPWVLDGLNRTERNILQALTRFRNQQVASLIPGMPFMKTVETSDAATLGHLSTLDTDVPKLLPAISQLTWVGDGIEGAETRAIRWIHDFNDTDIALSVIGLGWVQDGIENEEIDAIEELSYLEAGETGVAASVVGFFWVQDGVDDLEFEALEWIGNFRGGEAAASVVGLPWIQDGIEEQEVAIIEELSYVEYDDSTLALTVAGLEWMQDGVDDLEFEALEWIGNFSNPEVASSVVALEWARDDIEETEVKTIEELSYIDYDSRELALAVVGLEWMQGEVDELEFEALEWIGNFSNPEVASSVVALEWARDDIEETEVKTIEELSYIDYDSRELALAVVGLGWVRDGVKEQELEGIRWIENFGDALVVLDVVELGWVQDGLGPEDTRAIQELSYLSNKDAAQASRIVEMPFLEFLDPADVSAIDSLSNLAWFRQDDFQRVLSHPTLSNGITDDWAKIVATLYGVSDTNPALIDTLLNPEQVSIEETTIDLPLAGETLLTIIRTAPGAERSMDLLEHAVHHHEEYMATSFPTGYVGWLFGDAVTPSFAGTNFGTHIASLSQYDVDDGSDDAEYAGRHSAHEVAHYYWRDNNNWVDEGIANFMEYISENARTDQPIEVTEYPCGYLRTIAELEALEVTSEEGDDSVFTCNYALGERLFLDLYRNLGADAFRQGLRNLYLVSQTVQEDDGEAGIEHVRTAFKDVEGVDDQVVDMITARWYDGTEPYDTSARDTDPVNRRFITVNGGIDVAYLAATSGGPPATSFSANSADDWVQLFLDYSYSVGNTTEVPLELVTYFEDGFVFDREYVTFTAAPGFIGATWWLSVGASPSNPWAPGKYEVYVYNEGRKLVELEYEVTE